MPKPKKLWFCKSEFDYGTDAGGGHYGVGQLIAPLGLMNDYRMFAENDATFWTAPFVGDGVECGADGCQAVFANDAYLRRHRARIHAPEREYRARMIRQVAQDRLEAEEGGETIGGRPVVAERGGPGGRVPYIEVGR